jgi:hypothetical protein
MSNSSQNHILTANELILQRLEPFYQNEANMNKFLKCINQQYIFSLRHVDWFVTNFAKKYFTIIQQKVSQTETNRFKVYSEYKLECKSYSKRKFDPFCRNERITIPYPSQPNIPIQTTIGQLNFFEWAIRNNLIEYIVDHYEEIDHDMHERNSISKKSKSKKKRVLSSSLSSLSSLNSTSSSLSNISSENETMSTEIKQENQKKKKKTNIVSSNNFSLSSVSSLSSSTSTFSSVSSVASQNTFDEENCEQCNEIDERENESKNENDIENSFISKPLLKSSSTSSFIYNTNNLTKKGKKNIFISLGSNQKTRKKREELSVSAIKSLKKENVDIIVRFDLGAV